ncbi:hypothetical protein JG688_00008983 [Phytophthora aleatoria]|uniref:Uncharacterized protein n=1 Tax=Phytophthora aleatoria TaxID=2496075 RepID=A0A8J5M4B4_9STRA|nr:hypothetical protein JG688_00008983 [Phytophthora aleatoria]
MKTAQASSAVHNNAHLRKLTATEADTLLAYLRGEIELRHPPSFIKAVLSVLQRAILEDFHRTYVEYSLTADVPAGVQLGRRPAHMTILEDIFKENTGANYRVPMVSRLAKDAKRLHFDCRHTLTLVFYSKRLARSVGGQHIAHSKGLSIRPVVRRAHSMARIRLLS